LEQSDCQRIAGHPILRCVNVLRDSARVADAHAARKVVPIRRIPGRQEPWACRIFRHRVQSAREGAAILAPIL